MYVIPYKAICGCHKSKSRPFALKLGTIHLLAESFPTSYRPKKSDKKCPFPIFCHVTLSVLAPVESLLIVNGTQSDTVQSVRDAPLYCDADAHSDP
jgi:hypothetical protein